MAHGLYIPLYETLDNHPKFNRLCRLLEKRSDDERDLLRAKLENLWLWTLRYFENGNLAGCSAEDISCAARWSGDPHEFFNALLESKFIKNNESGIQIYDWNDYGGKMETRREYDRNRKKTNGNHKPDGGGPDNSSGIPTETDGIPDNSENFQVQEVEVEVEKEVEKAKAKKLLSTKTVDDREFESQFNEIWTAWQPPKRRGCRGTVERALKKALCIIPFDELILAVSEYASSPYVRSLISTEPHFIKLLSTWLNAKGWTEDRSAWQCVHRGGTRAPPVRQLFDATEGTKYQYKF